MLVQASQDALRHLEIIMVGTKFPENIGMAARACANTGCGRLTLVSPAWWDKEKARPLATAKGEPLLDAIEVKPTLGDALAPNVLTFGTTARTGGWRRGLLTPEQAAGEIAPLLHEGSRVAIVFGCEDRGLSNADIEQCQEQALLYARLKETLLAIDYLKSDNPDYFLMPLRRFLGKSGLRRHEMDMLMGICRQVDNLRKEAGK